MKAAVLWAGIATGPTAWFLSQLANFAWSPLACSGGGKITLYLVSLAAVAVTVLAGAVSYTQLREPVTNEGGEVATRTQRQRAMALAGMGLSCLSVLVIVAQAIPNIMFGGCE